MKLSAILRQCICRRTFWEVQNCQNASTNILLVRNAERYFGVSKTIWYISTNTLFWNGRYFYVSIPRELSKIILKIAWTLFICRPGVVKKPLRLWLFLHQLRIAGRKSWIAVSAVALVTPSTVAILKRAYSTLHHKTSPWLKFIFLSVDLEMFLFGAFFYLIFHLKTWYV